jgi:hypothetical protein
MPTRRLLGSMFGAGRKPTVRTERSPRRYALVLMQPSIGRHLDVFREIMDVVAAGLADLGCETVRRVNELGDGEEHIVFCPHLLRAEDVQRVAASTILYNFEPLNPPTFDTVGTFLAHYAPRCRVWDYSADNVDYLRKMGCSATHVPLGYADVLSRIERAPAQDIDVLFYGDLSARRTKVLDALRATGLNLVVVADAYGAERDALIARAKIVLNVHHHDRIKALETPRVFYLLANRKAVVTEAKPDVPLDDDLRGAVVTAPYDGIVDACVALVRDAGRRAALEEAALVCIKARPEAKILADALDALA